jgi:cellulose synthase/poly-beta-1,6-N-acetylglucosamine synthase-like glycosyltransferase
MLFSYILIALTIIFFYPIFIYPALIYILDKIFGKNFKYDRSYKPKVTVLLAAYNEENMLEDAINSVLESDYPKNKFNLIIGSDGSNDKTFEVADKIAKSHSNVFAYQFERGGKNLALNRMFDLLDKDTEIVYFMDADFRLKKDTLSEAIKYFADPQVSVVMSKMDSLGAVSSSNSGSQGEGIYYKFEQYLKIRESRVWSTINNIGSYCARAKELKKIPTPFVCDDMFTIVQITLKKKRVIYALDSVIEEVREKATTEEFRRRSRLATGQFCTLRELPGIINPLSGLSAFFFFSHKFLRHLYPLLIILIAGFTALTYNESRELFNVFLIVQTIFYSFALIGMLFEKLNIKNFKIFSFPYYFITINSGFMYGAIKFLAGKSGSTWERIDT